MFFLKTHVTIHSHPGSQVIYLLYSDDHQNTPHSPSSCPSKTEIRSQLSHICTVVTKKFINSIGNPGSLCVTRDITQVNYREHMRRSLGLKMCQEMEIKIDETYHVASCCCP